MIVIIDTLFSEDKTRRYRFKTSQDDLFDAAVVFFNDTDNAPVNICISSQIGCKSGCLFCVSGTKKFRRNLTTDEIVGQIDCIFKEDSSLSKSKFEITYMGSGEPLDNFDTVIASIQHIQNFQNLCKINISTTIPSIKKDFFLLSGISKQVHLQYSMNFVDDATRSKYLQSPTLPSIDKSLAFLHDIAHSIKDNPCISYILFDGINDSIEKAKILCDYAKKTNAYLKICEYVPIPNSILRPSQNKKTFCDEIGKQNVIHKEFKSKGIDIYAACGHFLSDVAL
jgi:23S rRNA (adenine2503-C2)-methyltransferase